MKFSDIKVFSLEEIKENIKIKEKNFQFIKMYHPLIGLKKNPMEIRMLRKDIARLKTELNKRKINDQKKES
ncbi:50S ribosomal protein L29 [Blattabacterium cuenoti]|uniref:50S ribosomal protein L29 n=1 Tax=Blattabacterium cuenoti TaxID=1653831 RepID=UPI00163C7693|nr:50S ribosomal protein L29 [Blattabacterium cuenoti]